MRTIPQAVWVDTSNLSAATRYYPVETNDASETRGLLLEAPAEMTLNFDISGGVTLTVEWCGHITGTNLTPDTNDWLDITDKGVPVDGTAVAASYVDAKDRLVFKLQPGRVRVKVVTADASNAVQIIAYVQYVEGGNTVNVGSSALPAGAAKEERQTSTTCVSVAAKTAPATPAAAEAIVAASTPCHTGVLIAASESNGNLVYVGGTGVTTATGIALAAGDTLFLPVTDAALVFCVGAAAAQVVKAVVL